jgi:hypothetical protein
VSAATRLRDLAARIAGDTFAVCLLAAVLAATVLAFGLGAEADLIVIILIMGVATAFAETTMRARNNKGHPK